MFTFRCREPRPSKLLIETCEPFPEDLLRVGTVFAHLEDSFSLSLELGDPMPPLLVLRGSLVLHLRGDVGCQPARIIRTLKT